MIYILNYRDIAPKGVHVYNVTSRSETFTRNLSPFLLGPAVVNDLSFKNVENAWQYSKVYAQHFEEDKLSLRHYEWMKKGAQKTYADRYPVGKGIKPVGSLYDGKIIDYVEARKKIYIPLYSKCAYDTPAFRRLAIIYRKKGTIALRDFDAYDHYALGYDYQDVINDKERKMGHGFVLAMMLDHFIEEGEIIE